MSMLGRYTSTARVRDNCGEDRHNLTKRDFSLYPNNRAVSRSDRRLPGTSRGGVGHGIREKSGN